MRRQYQEIYLKKTNHKHFRKWAKGKMYRLTVMIKVCYALTRLADTLDEFAKVKTPSAEATGICAIARQHFPEVREEDK